METNCFQKSVPSAHVSTQTDRVHEVAVARRSANYHPTVWGDFFLAFSSNSLGYNSTDEAELQNLKEMVKNMLEKTSDKPIEKLDFIDTIQRLGVAYHFETEIKASLHNIYDSHCQFSEQYDHEEANDLRVIALKFRLLRHQGYPISSDVFNKFKDDEDNLNKSLLHDNIRGSLSLYEAAQYRIHGENILDEALEFTISHLKSLLPTLSNFQAAEVSHSLKHPIHRTLTRVATRFYFPVYESDESHNAILLKFAKLNFNMLQKMHQKELSDLTEWWKGLDFPEKLPFARDRLAECYFWILGLYFEPKYYIARKCLAKVIAMTSLLDDIYDVYGTLDELTVFTYAIERWEISAADELPLYMKHSYKTLLDAYLEMEEELAKQNHETSIFRISYAKIAMKEVVRAFFQEAKWYFSDYVPSLEEYLGVSLFSAAYKMLATNSFAVMGEMATKEALHWVSNQPVILRSASIICRLMDDMAGHEFEQERGHNATAVECYMKQKGVSKQEAYAEFKRMITNAWKDINKECLEPTAVPRPLLQQIVNMAQVINLLYKNEDSFTHSKVRLKNMITLLLVDAVKI